jgi:hypothetical protein
VKNTYSIPASPNAETLLHLRRGRLEDLPTMGARYSFRCLAMKANSGVGISLSI